MLRDKIISAAAQMFKSQGSREEGKITYICMDTGAVEFGLVPLVPGVVDLDAAALGFVHVAVGLMAASSEGVELLS